MHNDINQLERIMVRRTISVLATALSRAWEEQGRQQDWGLRAPMKW